MGAAGGDSSAGGDPDGRLVAIYRGYQDRLLSITARNRTVLLRRMYAKHNCDLAALEPLAGGAASGAIGASPIGGSRGGATHMVLPNSAKGDAADGARERFKALARNIGRIEEETDQQTGYLGFPFLVGHAAPDFYVRGPVALFPLSIEYRPAARGGGWAVAFHDKMPVVNSSLFMALKKKGGHPVPDDYEDQFNNLVEETLDSKGSREGLFFNRLNDWLQSFLPADGMAAEPRLAPVAPLDAALLARMAREPLRLANHRVIGSFPLADSKIYGDYNELIARAGDPDSGLVSVLFDLRAQEAGARGGGGGGGATVSGAGEAGAGHPAQIRGEIDIDSTPSIELNTVLPSDSSQDAVVIESQKSSMVVVRGPPGTGKSQVIVNLVSDALMRGEKVLIVCQKRAALEVVRQRLEAVQLDKYAVFLEKEIDDRVRMYGQLRDIIDRGREGGGAREDLDGVAADIDGCVRRLREFGRSLHSPHGGATAFDVYSAADSSYRARLDLARIGGLPDWDGLEDYLRRMRGVEDAVRRFDDPAHPFHGRRSLAGMTSRQKSDLKGAVADAHERAARCILLGTPGNQDKAAAALRLYLSDPVADSPSAEIERFVFAQVGRPAGEEAGGGSGGGDRSEAAAASAAGKAILATVAGGAAGAASRASGTGEAEDGTGEAAAAALDEFSRQRGVREAARALSMAAKSSMLVGGPAEQEALCAALEAFASGPPARASAASGGAPPQTGIERLVRIQRALARGGPAGKQDAGAFRSMMAECIVQEAGTGPPSAATSGSGAEKGIAALSAALSEYARLCGALACVRTLLAAGESALVAPSSDAQGDLVAALEEYLEDGSLLKKGRKRAAKRLEAAGFAACATGEDAARSSLVRARKGVGFWEALSRCTNGGLLDAEQAAAAGQAAAGGGGGVGAGLGSALSRIRDAAAASMQDNALSGWAKALIRAGARCAPGGDGVGGMQRNDGDGDGGLAAIVPRYIDDPSPLREGPAREEGAGRGALEASIGEMFALCKERLPDAPDLSGYERIASDAVSRFALLHRASVSVAGLARLAPVCALAKNAGDQARLPQLFRAAGEEGIGARRRRAAAKAEIERMLAVGPSDPSRAAEESEKGLGFWDLWPDAELAAKALDVRGTGDALGGREALAEYLEGLSLAIGSAMDRSPLAEWAKGLFRLGEGAALVAAGGREKLDDGAPGGLAQGMSGAATLGGDLVAIDDRHELAEATAAADRSARSLAGRLAGPVRSGTGFWSGYLEMRDRLGRGSESGDPAPDAASLQPADALREVADAEAAADRAMDQSPLSEWARVLAASGELSGGGSNDPGARRAAAERVAHLYMESSGMFLVAPRGGAGPREPPAGHMDGGAAAPSMPEDAARLLMSEMERKGMASGATSPPTELPDGDTAAEYERAIADALSMPEAEHAPARWVKMIAGCALGGLDGGDDGRPDSRAMLTERQAGGAAAHGFLDLAAGSGLHSAAEKIKRARLRLAADAAERAEEGQGVWGALARVWEGYGIGKKAGLPAGPADPAGVEAFVSAAKAALDDGGALDDVQDLDKKKAEYEEGMFVMLEMARARFGPAAAAAGGDSWTDLARSEIYAHWLDGIEREHPVLTGQPVENYQADASRLESLAERKRGLVIRAIQDKIESVRLRDVYGGSAAAPGLAGDRRAWRDLLAELKKKRRVMPVRRLLELHADRLFKIAPCWLASPESVSKTLPLKRGLFDLVIVDEASQLAVERSLPFLYRGKRAVIAGDEKQLQPFDLFQMRDDDGGDGGSVQGGADRLYDEKSLLDMAMVRHMAVNLEWHYRSRHQDLINFSNHAFYSGGLYVAPDAEAGPGGPPLRWVECAGTWDERVNEKEAEEVVKQIKRVWSGGDSPSSPSPPSVGVITFNEAQQNLIWDRIEEAREADAEFNGLYVLAHEGGRKDASLFVKNIENVQGDERDVIIFSVGYARDPEGAFRSQFGSLNMKGGENRLNVAVTRARRSMVVVSSIDPSMISGNTAHDGPRRLRQFLEYARAVSRGDEAGRRDALAGLPGGQAQGVEEGRGAPGGPDKKGEEAADLLGPRIRRGLEEAGYEVRASLGFSGYKVDLAVVHPHDRARYVAGIEYDGATFRSARSVMERDVMRPAFLRSKGWAFERTWSRSWWKDPEAELERLKARITEAMMRP